MTKQNYHPPLKQARRAIRENISAATGQCENILDLHRIETLGNGAAEWVINKLTADDVHFPSSVKNEFGPQWPELERLYRRCVDLNNEYVGLPNLDAMIQLSDSYEVRQIREAFYQICDKVWFRWQKKVQRLGYLESRKRFVTRAIEPLNSIRGEKLGLLPMLTDFTDYLPYLIVREHFLDNFSLGRIGRPWELEFELVGTGSLARSSNPAVELMELEQHAKLYLIQRVVAAGFHLAVFNGGSTLPLGFDAVIQQALDDIVAMRTRLFAKVKPEHMIVEVKPGWWVQFDFAPCTALLNLALSDSHESLIAWQRRNRYRMQFHIDFDGQPIFTEDNWSTPERMDIFARDVQWFNYLTLPKIRDRLLEQYSHLPPMETPEVDDRPLLEAPLEEIELAVDYWSHHQQEQLADPQVEERHAPYISGRLPQLRKSTVIRRLEKLGVDVGRAKGSELKFFKPGGRVFVMGDHGGNDRLPSHLLAKMVKRLGLTSREVKHLIVG